MSFSRLAKCSLVLGSLLSACAPAAQSKSSSVQRAVLPDFSTRALPDRERPPASGEEAQFRPPTILERRLANGIRIFSVEQRELPLVRATLLVRRGASDAPAGVASFAMTMLQRSLPQGVYSYANYDSIGAQITSITRWHGESRPPDFGNVSRFFRHPEFTPEAFERERQRRLELAPETSLDDETRLQRLERLALYPPGHPYRELLLGGVESLSQIKPAELERFFQDQVQPDQIVVAAVGDVATESLRDSVEAALGGWQSRAVPRQALPEPITTPPGGAQLTLIDHPGLTQARVLVASRGAPWSSADFYPLRLLNLILGGSPTARLNLNLREDKTYSYGVFSDYGIWRGAAPFTVRGVVGSENLSQSLLEILKELERLRREPVLPQELEHAQREATRKFPTMFATLASTLDAVCMLGAYQRPADTYAEFPAKIGEVSAQDLLRVARQYLAPENVRWFVIADAAAVQSSLADLPLGAAEVLSLRTLVHAP